MTSSNRGLKAGKNLLGIVERSLPNGLKVLLIPDHSAPVVSYMTVFKVGSRNEAVGFTGATHFLEHMMFKGTRKFDAAKGLGLDDLLKQVGAMMNANTWFDRTTYFEVVPSEQLELCIRIEADRMRGLCLRQADHDSEMTVVRNELERGENEPDQLMDKEMYAVAFREHPYHHTTIGWRSDVENVSMARLREFYDTYYWPNNATVVVAGDFEIDEVMAMLQKYYGRITRSPKPIPQVYTVEPPQIGLRRFTVQKGTDLPRVWFGYRVPEATHADSYPLAVAARVLGGSQDRTSRLYKGLVETGLSSQVYVRHDELKDPALLMVAATLNPGIEPSVVEDAIAKIVASLATEPATEAELADIRTANEKGTTLIKADAVQLAFIVAESESKADWTWLLEYDGKFAAVTGDDVMSIAAKYLVEKNCTVGIYLPSPESANEPAEGDGDEASVQAAAVPATAHSALKKVHKKRERKVQKATPAQRARLLTPRRKSGSRKGFAEQVTRTVLPNGLTLLVMPRPGSGSVAVSAAVRAGNLYEKDGGLTGVADIVAEMLTKGSKGYSKTELAAVMKKMGVQGGLHMHADTFSLGTGATVVTSDLSALLPVLADVLINPLLSEQEFGKTKVEWHAQLNEQKSSTYMQAFIRLYQAIYPQSHPLYVKGFDEQFAELERMTRDDVVAFHNRFYTPSSTVLTLVGDIDAEQALAAVSAAFGSWSGEPVAMPEIPVIALPASTEQIPVFMPEKDSADIMLGHPTFIKRSDPDFHAYQLAVTILGGDTLISRLGKVVREENGLTYGIYSQPGDSRLPGSPWTVALTVNPANADRALSLVREVTDKFLAEGINENELAREAQGKAGTFIVQMRSSMGIASLLTRFELEGSELSALDEHAAKFLSLTKDEVDAAARKYLHPDRAVTVLAGTLKK